METQSSKKAMYDVLLAAWVRATPDVIIEKMTFYVFEGKKHVKQHKVKATWETFMGLNEVILNQTLCIKIFK